MSAPDIDVLQSTVAVVEVLVDGAVVSVDEVHAAVVEVMTGVPGPPGAPGGALSREVAITTPTATWVLPLSGWSRRPHVTLYDTAGIEIEADVFASPELVSVTFPTPTAGSAVLI